MAESGPGDPAGVRRHDSERERLLARKVRRLEDRIAALEDALSKSADQLERAEARGRRWLQQNSIVYEVAKRAVVPIRRTDPEFRTRVAARSALRALDKVLLVLTEG